MKTSVNIKKLFKISFLFVSAIIVSFSFSSCDFEYDIIEQGSIADLTPPKAAFSAIQATSAGPEDWKIYSFSNESSSATDFMWDFGDGNTSTEKDPTNTFPGEDTYTVTLIASDKLGVKSTFTSEVMVVEPVIPVYITPEIKHGDFEDKTGAYTWNEWKISDSNGGTSSPYNASSDGDPVDYAGTDTGSKTRGAKWTGSTSAGPSLSKSSRFSYQAITVSPNVEYVIEFSHAIKTDKTDIAGGDRVIVEILDGHFTDRVAAVASTPIVTAIGDVANGKGNFKVIKEKFTSTATGEISIFIYAITKDELYVDNVKVYPSL